MSDNNKYDVVIVGGGPCGLAAAIEVQKRGMSYIVLEKGSMTESLRRYPKRMRFFSTAENIEIGGIPFPTSNVKPGRTEALQYYRKVAAFYQLNFKLFTEVTDIEKEENIFFTKTDKGDTFLSDHLIIATGYFDIPRKLEIPGEDLSHVSHYYDEPYGYSYSDVVIVGGGNSAIEAALELYRHDVNVTIVHRRKDFKPTVKYWLVPDIQNRIKEGKIKVLFEHEAEKITKGKIGLKNLSTGERTSLNADFVFLLIGYLPDEQLLRNAGLQLDQHSLLTKFDGESYETQVENLYLCGTVLAGIHTEKVFIENGREHARKIAESIAAKEN